ncbi:hypothetical protein, partial [Cellulomonas cellasea]
MDLVTIERTGFVFEHAVLRTETRKSPCGDLSWTISGQETTTHFSLAAKGDGGVGPAAPLRVSWFVGGVPVPRAATGALPGRLTVPTSTSTFTVLYELAYNPARLTLIGLVNERYEVEVEVVVAEPGSVFDHIATSKFEALGWSARLGPENTAKLAACLNFRLGRVVDEAWANHTFWIDDFTGEGRSSLLLYFPADK